MNTDTEHPISEANTQKDSRTKNNKSAQQWCLRLGKFFLLAVMLYFVGAAIIERVSGLDWHGLNIDFRFLPLALLFLISGRILMGIFYERLLYLLNSPVPRSVAMSVCWVAGIGKYVPGKVAILANSVYLLSFYKIRAAVAAIIPVLNNGMAVLISLLLASPLLFSSWTYGQIPFSRMGFVLLIIAGCVALWPPFFLGMINILLGLMKRPRITVRLTFGQMFFPLCIILGQCLLTGLSTWCMARAVAPLDAASILPIVSVNAMAGALGILALFAPAGIGVREGVFLVMLSQFVGEESAALLTICLRLLQIITDVLMAALGMAVFRVV